MERNIALKEIGMIAKQRNLFLTLTLMLSTALTLLAIKIITNDERTILVPGLSQSVWIEKAGVSKTYLEETSLMYLPLLLDLSVEVIQHKANIIFKYISQSDESYMRHIQEYFATSREQYKQFNLSTYFSVKNMEVDASELVVIAHGTLTSRYGERGFETQKASYKLSYEWMAGHLRLKEFIRELTSDEAKTIERAKLEREKLEAIELEKNPNNVKLYQE